MKSWSSPWILAFGLAGGCSTLDVTTNQAPGVDFSRYRTFDFDRTPDPDADKVYFSEINQERVRAAIARELKARGYEPAANPDLRISIYLQVADKQEIIHRPYPYAGSPYYHGRSYPYDRAMRSAYVVDYTEGTLIVDLVDSAENRLVWQGVAQDALNEKARISDEEINRAVNAIFAQYPGRLVDATPVRP